MKKIAPKKETKPKEMYGSGNPGSGYVAKKTKVKANRKSFQHSFPEYKLANSRTVEVEGKSDYAPTKSRTTFHNF